MSGWFKTRPALGPMAPISHYFGRGSRVPHCIGHEDLDGGGTLSLLADELAPRCVACTAALLDDADRAVGRSANAFNSPSPGPVLGDFTTETSP